MSFLDQALRYASMGWRVFACHEPVANECSCGNLSCKSKAKHPRTARGLSDATTDPAIIERSWTLWPTANIGLLLPHLVLDVDPRHDGDKSLVGKHLPATLCSKTGSGGWHYVFKTEVPFLTRNGVLPGIDIKGGNRGYIIAPPSRHICGGTYEWVEGMGPGEIDIAVAPEWLTKTVQHPSNEKREPLNVAEALAKIKSGSWHDDMLRIVGRWVKDGWTDQEILLAGGKQTFPGYTLEQTIDEIQVMITGARTKGYDSKLKKEEPVRNVKAVHISVVGAEALVKMRQAPPKVYETAIPKLDFYLTGGFQGGELIYMGARPGVGKTAIALQIATNVARKGNNVLIISREMRNNSLMLRLISQDGSMTATELRRLNLSDEKFNVAKVTVGELSRLPIYFSDEAARVEEIVEMVSSSEARKKGLLVIIDYLQLLRSGEAGSEKRVQIEASSKMLKNLALECDVPVLCMSSLSRAFDKKNPRPTMDSLRDSGELEHDADVILLLHREFGATVAELEVAKNRNGHVGNVALTFAQEHLSFKPVDEPGSENYSQTTMGIKNPGHYD